MLAWLCLGQDASLHMAQQLPLPITISCSSKSRLVLPSWCRLIRVLLDKIQDGRKTVVCVCVCVHACVHACMHVCVRAYMCACVRASLIPLHKTVLRPSWILSGTTQVSWHQKGKTRKVKPYGRWGIKQCCDLFVCPIH